MRPRHSLDRLLAQLRHGRPPNFFPHLLVVAPVANALALSSSSAGIVPMRWASRAVYDAANDGYWKISGNRHSVARSTFG
jgi:hypothetical protein